MLDLFSKLEQVKTTTSDLLSPTDRAFCDMLFTEYKDFTDQLSTAYSQLTALSAFIKPEKEITDYYSQPPFYEMRKGFIEEIDKLYVYTAQANEKLIHKIEGYFTTTYKLNFDSLLLDYEKKKRSRYDDEQGEEKPADTYTEYDFIIQHMTKQTGTDFKDYAFQQLCNKFSTHFHLDRDTPELKNKTLSLPDFSYFNDYDKFRIPYQNTEMPILFSALSYFETRSPNYTSQISRLYNKLREEIESGKYPVGEKASSIRLFKNGKVEIEFISKETAQAFWHMFKLDDAIERIKTNARR